MRALALLVWLAVGAFAQPARAQDAPGREPETGEPSATDASDLDELQGMLQESVVTTASRGAERASSAPASVFTITAAELWTYGIRTVDEALAYLGTGVLVNRIRDFSSGGEVGAQGLVLRDRGRHVLVLLDGMVWNAPETGAAELHEGLGVPLEAIDHIEVLLGAGSVVYGSNAMLAVVHIVTRTGAEDEGLHAVAELGLASPTDVDGQPTLAARAGERFGVRYRLGLGFATPFRLFDSDAEFTVRAEWLEDISSSFQTPHSSRDDFDFQFYPEQKTWGGVGHDGLRAPSAVAALRVGDFRLEIQASRYEREMPLSGTYNDPLAGEERSYLRADLRHSALFEAHVALITRLYAGLSDWSETSIWTSLFWCPPGQIDGCIWSAKSRGRWAGLEQQLSVDWKLDGTIATTLGYDIRVRDATFRSSDYFDLLTGEAPLTTRLPYTQSLSVLAAVFAQQVWQPAEWLILNGGARLDVDTLFGARVSPRFAATLLPTEGTTIRASYSEAFRAPSAFELNETDPTYRVRAPGLGAEIARTAEVEWQQRIVWLTSSLRGFAAFYGGFIDTRLATTAEVDAGLANGDLGSTADPASVVRWDNVDALRSLGGSLTLSTRPTEGLTIGGSLTISDTQRGGARVTLVPWWLANARIAYAFAPHGATLALVAAVTGRRTAFADFTIGEPFEASEQAQLRATFTSPLPALPGLSLRIAANYTINPLLPYVLSAPSEGYPDARADLFPNANTLFGFLGLQYDFDL